MTKNGYVFHAERLTGGASSNLDNGYQELIAAIIRQAVKDYLSCSACFQNRTEPKGRRWKCRRPSWKCFSIPSGMLP